MEILNALRAQWDRATAIALVGVGMLVLLLGYIGISGTAYVAEQLPYIISGGIFGLCLIITGATMWLSADLRDEWRKLQTLDERLERAFGAPVEPAPASTAVPAGAPVVTAHPRSLDDTSELPVVVP